MLDYRKAHAGIRLEDGTVLDCPCPDYPKPIPGPLERLITYEARCDREAYYRTAWAEFEQRGVVNAVRVRCCNTGRCASSCAILNTS